MVDDQPVVVQQGLGDPAVSVPTLMEVVDVEHLRLDVGPLVRPAGTLQVVIERRPRHLLQHEHVAQPIAFSP